MSKLDCIPTKVQTRLKFWQWEKQLSTIQNHHPLQIPLIQLQHGMQSFTLLMCLKLSSFFFFSFSYVLDLCAAASSTVMMKLDLPASLIYRTSPFISFTSFLLMSRLKPSSEASSSLPNISFSNDSGIPPPA